MPSRAGVRAACHLQRILSGSHVCRQRLGTAQVTAACGDVRGTPAHSDAQGHGMGSTCELVCICSGQVKRNYGDILKGHMELQHFQRQLVNDLHLKRGKNPKTKTDTQTVLLCKKAQSC